MLKIGRSVGMAALMSIALAIGTALVLGGMAIVILEGRSK